eukprot:TRINITY_DN36889_c0_g2_i3.p1 TRINITY_DN36889_c0_g2~~TRINITY_DN36889_c0_g2_i3.p1  ORF type:complete len:104 (-),score=28.11 TRINITY_DN36889_c0_g2_i3:11-322(-)
MTGDSEPEPDEEEEVIKKFDSITQPVHRIYHFIAPVQVKKEPGVLNEFEIEKSVLEVEVDRLAEEYDDFGLSLETKNMEPSEREIGRAVQQECRDRSRMPSSA